MKLSELFKKKSEPVTTGNSVIDFYNNYDEEGRLMRKSRMPEFLTTMKYIEKYLTPGARIIEIGAGTGRYSVTLAEKGYDVTSVELVPHNLDIMKEKVKEICTLIPAFEREIDWGRGKSLEGKDYCKYVFKNGSYFDNIAARESSRGKRRHGGLIEECVGVDGTILSEVILPTMNISRMCMDGTTQPEETLNKSQIYVTTAGWKNTFPYEKLIQLLIW